MDQYLKENKISTEDYKIGYLPLLKAFNQHSTSTPARLVQAPNRPGICINLVYSSSTYGSRDIPMIFGYTLTQCVRFFREHYLNPLNTKIFEDEDLANQANQIRLSFVDKILCAAYVDDVSVNYQFQS